jgi:hypothetical protein
MGTSDDERNAKVAAIMSGGQDNINRFLILGIINLQENGCARNCMDQEQRQSIRPHIAAGGIAASLIAIIESVKMFYGQK